MAKGSPGTRKSDKATTELAETVKPYKPKGEAVVKKKAATKKKTQTQRYRARRRRAPGRVR